jgi:NAD(P)H-quinone oxidoreductase subunit 5
MQFLRAPSMLHDYHQMHSAIGGEISPTGKQIEELLPERVQLWLYRWAFDRGHLDTILDRWVIDPLLQVSAYLAKHDRAGMSWTAIRAGNAAPIPVHGPAKQGND